MKNEYGYDPDESYTVEDNPFWDGTDAAHPAWWRGSDYGYFMAMKLFKKKLDDILESGVTFEKIHELFEHCDAEVKRVLDKENKGEKPSR